MFVPFQGGFRRVLFCFADGKGSILEGSAYVGKFILKGIIIMKMKLRRRIAAAMTAVVMSVSMMATNASASVTGGITYVDGIETYSGNWSLSQTRDERGYFHSDSTIQHDFGVLRYDKDKFSITCTSFYSAVPDDTGSAFCSYWVLRYNLVTGENVGIEVPRTQFHNTVGWRAVSLRTRVDCKKFSLRFYMQLENASVTLCNMSGKYKAV